MGIIPGSSLKCWTCRGSPVPNTNSPKSSTAQNSTSSSFFILGKSKNPFLVLLWVFRGHLSLGTSEFCMTTAKMPVWCEHPALWVVVGSRTAPAHAPLRCKNGAEPSLGALLCHHYFCLNFSLENCPVLLCFRMWRVSNILSQEEDLSLSLSLSLLLEQALKHFCVCVCRLGRHSLYSVGLWWNQSQLIKLHLWKCSKVTFWKGKISNLI